MGKPPSPSRSQSRFESNVFARLTSNLVQSENTGVEFQYKGHFRRSDSRTRNAGGPLVCSHIAEGHKGEVLSVCATDHLLFSASKGESGLSQQAALSCEIQLIKWMCVYLLYAQLYIIHSLVVFFGTTAKLHYKDPTSYLSPLFLHPHLLHPSISPHLPVLDRTVKIWDLSAMTEVAQLGNHASYVRKVAFCKQSKVFSASQTTVKVCRWK